MNGLHLIGDMSGCRCDPQLLLDGKRFEEVCVGMVQAAGLAVMEARFHQFEGSGFTGTVVLAESHVAIHTWPETKGLTLDVYVCNYSADNSAKARQLFEQSSATSSRRGRAP
jgi:spermidine synthase